jgi:hypothetical protein
MHQHWPVQSRVLHFFCIRCEIAPLHLPKTFFRQPCANLKLKTGHTFGIENLLDFDSLDQNLFHSTASNAKYILHFVQDHLHFDAPDQNLLDLIGFPVVGSCRIPAASLHPSPDRRPHSSFYCTRFL